MIVEVSHHLNAPLERLADDANPDSHVIFPVDDDQVPALRLFLDAFAVADPADVREVCRDGIASGAVNS